MPQFATMSNETTTSYTEAERKTAAFLLYARNYGIAEENPDLIDLLESILKGEGLTIDRECLSDLNDYLATVAGFIVNIYGAFTNLKAKGVLEHYEAPEITEEIERVRTQVDFWDDGEDLLDPLEEEDDDEESTLSTPVHETPIKPVVPDTPSPEDLELQRIQSRKRGILPKVLELEMLIDEYSEATELDTEIIEKIRGIDRNLSMWSDFIAEHLPLAGTRIIQAKQKFNALGALTGSWQI